MEERIPGESLIVSPTVKTYRLSFQGEYLPALSADNEQLVTFLTHQGYIAPPSPGAGEDQQSSLASVLAALRALAGTVPPHVQLWSYAWLCLPTILSLLLSAASNK